MKPSRPPPVFVLPAIEKASSTAPTPMTSVFRAPVGAAAAAALPLALLPAAGAWGAAGDPAQADSSRSVTVSGKRRSVALRVACIGSLPPARIWHEGVARPQPQGEVVPGRGHEVRRG